MPAIAGWLCLKRILECLPEYYEQILWFLTEKKGYIECNIDEDVEYFVDDESSGKKINVRRRVQKIEWQELNKELK